MTLNVIVEEHATHGLKRPIVDDKISYEWHDRSSLEEDAPTNSVSAGGVDMAPNARPYYQNHITN